MANINIFLANAKAKRQHNCINIASEVILRFSFKKKLDEGVSPGRSKRKGDKQVRMRKNTYSGTVKKDKRAALPRIHIDGFLYTIQLLFLLLGSPCLHSLHCLRSTAKGLPNTPHPEPTSTLLTSLLRPLLRSKMKIG